MNPPTYDEVVKDRPYWFEGQLIVAHPDPVGPPELTWLFTEISTGIICLCHAVPRRYTAADTRPTRMVFCYDPEAMRHIPLTIGSEKFWTRVNLLNDRGLKCILSENKFVCVA